MKTSGDTEEKLEYVRILVDQEEERSSKERWAQEKLNLKGLKSEMIITRQICIILFPLNFVALNFVSFLNFFFTVFEP